MRVAIIQPFRISIVADSCQLSSRPKGIFLNIIWLSSVNLQGPKDLSNIGRPKTAEKLQRPNDQLRNL
ncbi:hypothetical protein Pyn_22214 [Prunus yedoensis var. nudiflora]|uniref:Uncharacterized protein n=1 Tax=Prunus yedoensis var. nudiflora TaxID=2094558 RepID=A0A314ZQG7_PRUYE|nr:hypothetical protein Pyn_22214 [Prunus yedoensis var. nudiflora]